MLGATLKEKTMIPFSANFANEPERNCRLRRWDALHSDGWPRPQVFLNLQRQISNQEREANAHPNRGFNRGGVVVESGKPKNDPAFKKDNGDGKAASHPLAVLRKHPLEREDEPDRGRGHQEDRIDSGRDGK